MAQVRPDTEVIGIDEGQFFGNELIDVANALARSGMRVIIAGLDQDYTGKPWEPMPNYRGRRIYNEDARDLHEVRSARQLFTTNL